MASGSGSPCGACKFLRRKCAPECVFAPHFLSEESPSVFASIHRVFGASNVSKLLRLIPPSHRSDAVVAIAYEAQARMRDPVYGCVAHVFALHQQIASLQAQVTQGRARLGFAMANLQQEENPREKETAALPPSFSGDNSTSLNSSLDNTNLNDVRELYFKEDQSKENRPRKRMNLGEDKEFHDLALWMMRD